MPTSGIELLRMKAAFKAGFEQADFYRTHTYEMKRSPRTSGQEEISDFDDASQLDQIEIPNSTPAEVGDILNLVPEFGRAPLPPITDAV